jgi:hypothetical protein
MADQPDDLLSLGSEMHRRKRLHLLIAANGPKDVAYAQTLAVRLSKEPRIQIRAIVDEMTHRLAQEIPVLQNSTIRCLPSIIPGDDPPSWDQVKELQWQASRLVEWADFMVLAPLDADNIAKMMHGYADTLLLEVLRGWDVSKRILLIPGMTMQMWQNPTTQSQLSGLQQKWQWIRAMPPILWHYDTTRQGKKVVAWDAFKQVVNMIKNQADLLSLRDGMDGTQRTIAAGLAHGPKARSTLPPEIWTIILEYTDDWELAQAFKVYTALEMPVKRGWSLEPKDRTDPIQVFSHELEWTLLTADNHSILQKLSQAPEGFRELSALAFRLVLKFDLVYVLCYIETRIDGIFWSLGNTVVPTMASISCRPAILDWWHEWAKPLKTMEKLYDADALDGASSHGHVSVLEWWRHSGMRLIYTRKALEEASVRGHIQVLDWWHEVAKQDPEIVLKPGHSLMMAVQVGQLAAIRWWGESGLLIDGLESVCSAASAWGRADILELWREARGDEGIEFDIRVLLEPTKHAHINVLEWWKRYAHGKLPGMHGRLAKKVGYLPRDIVAEMHLLDGKRHNAEKWWMQNGLLSQGEPADRNVVRYL